MGKLISYYDLLTMIKKGNTPQKVEVESEIYEWDGEVYMNIDGDFLVNWFLENGMFDKKIEIIEENKIEKINHDFEITDLKIKINEIIDYLNERGNEDE